MTYDWKKHDKWEKMPASKRYEAEASRHDAERRRLDGIITESQGETREFGINTAITSLFSFGTGLGGIGALLTSETAYGIVPSTALLGLAAFSATYARNFFQSYLDSSEQLARAGAQREIIVSAFHTALAKQALYKREETKTT